MLILFKSKIKKLSNCQRFATVAANYFYNSPQRSQDSIVLINKDAMQFCWHVEYFKDE